MYIKNIEKKNQEIDSSWNNKNDVENLYKSKSHKKVVVKKCRSKTKKYFVVASSQYQNSEKNESPLKFIKSSQSNINSEKLNNNVVLTDIISPDVNATISNDNINSSVDNNNNINNQSTHSPLTSAFIAFPIITLFIIGSAFFIFKNNNSSNNYNRNLGRTSYTNSLKNNAIKSYQNDYNEV
ncbi:hypothetical protein PIROE2DRAFT_6087 [Piromyces sp. E2]|nr:hypothetical protein PIROE2DRAFT_6087 [Piromyces sp. E2]|eukprot:OUM66666.1 hypothetical protein PIROE2DRAFT_6087 [Piromyces sp. E2]